jgi:antitoxin (DNA-binding transcriptional repressor) of toxin-antitoxin stability system
MSLSIEIRVNGHPVATIVAHNTYTDVHGVASYDGQGVLFDQNGEPSSFLLTVPSHKRADGIIPLTTKLLKAATKVLKQHEPK